MGGGNQLHAAFRNGPGGECFQFGTHLVDDDHFGHVVLDTLDHHVMLQAGVGDLHATCPSNSGVWDIAIAGNFVRRVDNYDTLVGLVGQDACCLAQDRGLANTGPAQYQHALAGANQVFDQPHRPVDSTANPARQAHGFTGAVSQHRYSVEGAFDSSPVIVAKMSNMVDNVINLIVGDLDFTQRNLFAREPGFGVPAEVEYNLKEVPDVLSLT